MGKTGKRRHRNFRVCVYRDIRRSRHPQSRYHVKSIGPFQSVAIQHCTRHTFCRHLYRVFFFLALLPPLPQIDPKRLCNRFVDFGCRVFLGESLPSMSSYSFDKFLPVDRAAGSEDYEPVAVRDIHNRSHEDNIRALVQLGFSIDLLGADFLDHADDDAPDGHKGDHGAQALPVKQHLAYLHDTRLAGLGLTEAHHVRP